MSHNNLDQEFSMGDLFEQGALEAARALEGKYLVVGTTWALVRKAEGYPRDQNADGIYAPILGMEPGEVYCPQHRSAILLLIVTRDGGCILVRSVEIGGVLYRRPSEVTKHLGITETRTTGAVECNDDGSISVYLTGTLP